MMSAMITYLDRDLKMKISRIKCLERKTHIIVKFIIFKWRLNLLKIV